MPELDNAVVEKLRELEKKATKGPWVKAFISTDAFPTKPVTNWPEDMKPPRVGWCKQCHEGLQLLSEDPPDKRGWIKHHHVYPTNNGLVSPTEKTEVLTTEGAGQYPSDGDMVKIKDEDIDLIAALRNAAPALLAAATRLAGAEAIIELFRKFADTVEFNSVTGPPLWQEIKAALAAHAKGKA